MARYRYINDPESLKESLEEIVRSIHDEMDPHEMNEYKKFFKKNVSVFSRAYFTAFLIKQFVEGDGARSGRRSRSDRSRGSVERSGSGRGAGRRSAEVAPSSRDNGDGSNGGPGDPVSGDQQTLFVSVGKNRRVYPKDFVALLTELEGVTGEQIGQIKILDSYSFVEVDNEIADKVIDAYNGYEFRGRKLTVNYARNKKA